MENLAPPPPPGFDSWPVQPVAIRYTDYAIPSRIVVVVVVVVFEVDQNPLLILSLASRYASISIFKIAGTTASPLFVIRSLIFFHNCFLNRNFKH